MSAENKFGREYNLHFSIDFERYPKEGKSRLLETVELYKLADQVFGDGGIWELDKNGVLDYRIPDTTLDTTLPSIKVSLSLDESANRESLYALFHPFSSDKKLWEENRSVPRFCGFYLLLDSCPDFMERQIIKSAIHLNMNEQGSFVVVLPDDKDFDEIRLPKYLKLIKSKQ
jgi:hypothetical protein